MVGIDGADEGRSGLDVEVDGPVQGRDGRRKGCFRHDQGNSRDGAVRVGWCPSSSAVGQGASSEWEVLRWQWQRVPSTDGAACRIAPAMLLVVSCLWPGTGETRSAASANFRGGALSPWRRPQSSVAPSNIKAKQQFLPQILLAPSKTEACAILAHSSSLPSPQLCVLSLPVFLTSSSCCILHLAPIAVAVAVAVPSRYPRSL